MKEKENMKRRGKRQRTLGLYVNNNFVVSYFFIKKFNEDSQSNKKKEKTYAF